MHVRHFTNSSRTSLGDDQCYQRNNSLFSPPPHSWGLGCHHVHTITEVTRQRMKPQKELKSDYNNTNNQDNAWWKRDNQRNNQDNSVYSVCASDRKLGRLPVVPYKFYSTQLIISELLRSDENYKTALFSGVIAPARNKRRSIFQEGLRTDTRKSFHRCIRLTLFYVTILPRLLF